MKKGTVVDKYKNLSFAAAAKKISDKYPERDTSGIAERSFMAEMNELMRHQEMLKLKENAGKAIQKYRQPVEASAYAKKAYGDWLDTEPYDWELPNPWTGVDMAMNPVVPVLPLASKLKPLTGSAVTSLPTYPNDNTGINTDFSDVGLNKSAPLPEIKYPTDNTGIPAGWENVNATGPNIATYKPGEPIIKEPAAGAGKVSKFEDWLKNNVYSPLTVGKGVEALGKLAMLATGYDKAVPQYNPYESKIRQLMETRGVDLTQAKQDILSSENAAIQGLNDVRSTNVRTALAQNIRNRSADALARTSMQQQQLKSQQQMEYANTLDVMGRQRVQAENYAEQLTQQSKAGYQMGLQNILESVGGTGQKLTDYRANIAQQRLINSVLQTADFKLGDPKGLIEKAIRGQEVDINDAIRINQDIASGTITPEEGYKQLEELTAAHRQRTGALTTQAYGGWLKKMTK